MTYKNIKRNVVIAWIICILFYCIATLYGSHWFSRSGSLMVLLGAMSEYLLLQNQTTHMSTILRGTGTFGGSPITSVDPPEYHKNISKYVHITVILGTFIWGFGDLFVLSNT